MEGLGAEVSAKIRSAIKAKLIELEAYVDDELPDYIMVMVANNRTKAQMEDDLGLFLNNNTAAFTNWLHAVLEKLKKVTLEEVTKKDVKKKKVKKVTEKPVKKEAKDRPKEKPKEKDDKRENRSEKKISKYPKKPPGIPKSNNANLEELGERKRQKPVATPDDPSGWTDGYDPASLLKSAVDRSKKKPSPRLSPKKAVKRSSGSSKKEPKKVEEKDGNEHKQKQIVNLKEEANFYNPKSRGDNFEDKRERDDKVRRRDRSRSWSGGRHSSLGMTKSLVSKVIRPDPRDRSRSQSYDPMAMLSSRAHVPPRPSRPSGREEKGSARAINRAMMDADRSIMRSGRRKSPEPRYSNIPEPRYKDIQEPRYKDVQEPRYKDIPEPRRHIERNSLRSERPPRLSPGDIDRYEQMKSRHEDEEDLKGNSKEMRQRERDQRDRRREEIVRLDRKQEERQLAMDTERDDRDSRMDQRLKSLAMNSERDDRDRSKDKRLVKSLAMDTEREDRDRNRLVKKRGDSKRRDEVVEEDLRIVVRRDITPPEPESPPRRRLEDEDAELLEMRRKALESLMKRTDRDIMKKRRDGSSGSSSSDSDESTGESEGSATDMEKSKDNKPEPTFIVTMDGIGDIDKYFKKIEPPRSGSPSSAKEIKEKEAIESKASSDGELELHADEDFDEEPKDKVSRRSSKVKSHKGASDKVESTEKPIMKVAARKRSPIEGSEKIKDISTKSSEKKVAAVKPVVVTKSGSAAKLAAAYSAKLSAIKAAKPDPAATEKTNKSYDHDNGTKADSVPAQKKPISALSPKKKQLAPPTTPTSPSVKIKTIPAKPVLCTDSKVPPSVVPKKKFTPILPPTPDPPSKAPNRIVKSELTAGSICTFWPKCFRKDSCAFYHPPPPAVVSKEPQGGPNRFKWSASN